MGGHLLERARSAAGVERRRAAHPFAERPGEAKRIQLPLALVAREYQRDRFSGKLAKR